MFIDKLFKVSILFLMGFLVSNLFNFYMVYGIENPLSNDFLKLGFSKKTPNDFIKENQIDVYQDRIVIHIENASLGRYAATGSMVPTLDENSNGIRIKPNSPEDIQVGDIITFKQKDYLVIHRVVEKGVDEKGVYFITKGDNNSVEDGKVRFEDIEYITVGMLW